MVEDRESDSVHTQMSNCYTRELGLLGLLSSATLLSPGKLRWPPFGINFCNAAQKSWIGLDIKRVLSIQVIEIHCKKTSLFQCSFGNVPCNLNETVNALSSNADFCLSFNPGEHQTVIGLVWTGLIFSNSNQKEWVCPVAISSILQT